MNRGKELYDKWKTDYDFQTLFSAAGGLLSTVIYALYNGYLGAAHASLWHGTICVYYLVLAALRAVIVGTERRIATDRGSQRSRDRTQVAASALLLFLNVCLVVPLTLLVKQEKPVSMTLIPAIASAAYATYKITMASIHLSRRKTSANHLVKLLRTINFVDALVSILVLQNTLIMVASHDGISQMLTLTALTSGAIWLVILILSVASLIGAVRGWKERQANP